MLIPHVLFTLLPLLCHTLFACCLLLPRYFAFSAAAAVRRHYVIDTLSPSVSLAIITFDATDDYAAGFRHAMLTFTLPSANVAYEQAITSISSQ